MSPVTSAAASLSACLGVNWHGTIAAMMQLLLLAKTGLSRYNSHRGRLVQPRSAICELLSDCYRAITAIRQLDPIHSGTCFDVDVMSLQRCKAGVDESELFHQVTSCIVGTPWVKHRLASHCVSLNVSVHGLLECDGVCDGELLLAKCLELALTLFIVAVVWLVRYDGPKRMSQCRIMSSVRVHAALTFSEALHLVLGTSCSSASRATYTSQDCVVTRWSQLSRLWRRGILRRRGMRW